jgi:hypothetical protein
VLCLSILTPLGGAKSAQAQIRLPDLQASTVYSRTYLGCIIDSRHYLSLRNTTSGTIRVGTPVYWSGKQEGQQPREYSAPLYANVSPGGVYQIGGAYKYDPSVQCRVWILRPRVATRAP